MTNEDTARLAAHEILGGPCDFMNRHDTACNRITKTLAAHDAALAAAVAEVERLRVGWLEEMHGHGSTDALIETLEHQRDDAMQAMERVADLANQQAHINETTRRDLAAARTERDRAVEERDRERREHEAVEQGIREALQVCIDSENALRAEVSRLRERVERAEGLLRHGRQHTVSCICVHCEDIRAFLASAPPAAAPSIPEASDPTERRVQRIVATNTGGDVGLQVARAIADRDNGAQRSSVAPPAAALPRGTREVAKCSTCGGCGREEGEWSPTQEPCSDCGGTGVRAPATPAEATAPKKCPGFCGSSPCVCPVPVEPPPVAETGEEKRFSDRPAFTPRELEAAKDRARSEGRVEGIREALEAVRRERRRPEEDEYDYNHAVDGCIRAIERLTASRDGGK